MGAKTDSTTTGVWDVMLYCGIPRGGRAGVPDYISGWRTWGKSRVGDGAGGRVQRRSCFLRGFFSSLAFFFLLFLLTISNGTFTNVCNGK